VGISISEEAFAYFLRVNVRFHYQTDDKSILILRVSELLLLLKLIKL